MTLDLETVAHALNDFLDGMTTEEVADKHMVSAGSVRLWKRQAGLVGRRRGGAVLGKRQRSVDSTEGHGRDPDARIVRPSVQRMYR